MMGTFALSAMMLMLDCQCLTNSDQGLSESGPNVRSDHSDSDLDSSEVTNHCWGPLDPARAANAHFIIDTARG